MSDENPKIMTLHPLGKKGVNILRSKYDLIRDYILKTLKREGEITFQQLNSNAVRDLAGTFEGKVAWYVITVKLDLEARGLIEKIPGTKHQKIRLPATTGT
jgi:hypothetical protein